MNKMDSPKFRRKHKVASRELKNARDEARRKAEAEARTVEEARAMAEAEARARVEEDARKAAEAEAIAAARKAAEAEDRARRTAEFEEKARAEALRRIRARKAADAEAKAAREAEERRKAEAARKAEEEECARQAREAEERRRAAEREQEARQRAEAEALEAEAARAKAEAARKAQEEEEERARRAREAEERRRAAEREQVARQRAEAQALKAEAARARAEAARKAEDEERAREVREVREAEAREIAERREADQQRETAAQTPPLLPLTDMIPVTPARAETPPMAGRTGGKIDAAWTALTEIPVDGRHLARNRIITASREDPAHATFDVLRTRLLHALTEHGWRRVAITSPGKDCGKTFSAANLAISLSRQENCRTLLMDLDMRRPSLHNVLGVKSPGSVGGLLRGTTRPEDHLRRMGENPIHAGRNIAFALNDTVEPYASELLQDPRTAATMDRIEEIYAPDVLLFDLPPALFDDDVIAARPLFDGVLLVIGGGLTTEREVNEVEARLGEATPILGMVLNKAEGSDPGRYRY